MTKALPQQARERDIQRAILDWLAAERIWHIRLNTGAFGGTYNGKRRFFRFGRPGMADILAAPIHKKLLIPIILWVEVKATSGKQSLDQLLFQNEVEANGQRYVLARSLDDVIEVLK